MAVVLSELGRFDEAASAIRRAIALKPRHAAFYYTLTESCPLASAEPLIGAMLELARDSARFARCQGAGFLAFCLG